MGLRGGLCGADVAHRTGLPEGSPSLGALRHRGPFVANTSTPGSGGTAMPFYQKGDVRIRYEETGSGFPLLVTPGGGLNSRVSNWPTAVINAMEAFKNDFRCITWTSATPMAANRPARYRSITRGMRLPTISLR